MKRLLCLAAWLLVAGASVAAYADQLVVLSAAAVKTSVATVPARFAGTGEDSVQFQFGTAGAIRDKAMQGEPFDLVIVPPAAMAELVKRGLVDGTSQQALGTVRLGAAIALGHAPIDLGDITALKRVLTEAKSVGIADPARGATTGIYLAKLFASLGLADDMKSKLKVYAEGQDAMEAVAHHDIEIAIGQISEASAVAALAPLVPLPEAAQLKTVYMAAMGQHAAHPVAARRLLDFLVSAPVQLLFRSNGFDSGSNP